MGHWTLRDRARTVAGTLRAAKIDHLDGDQNLLIEPSGASQALLVNRFGVSNQPDETLRRPMIECEVEVLDHLENLYLAAARELVDLPVTAYGVWVDDDAHDHKTELHPLDVLVAKLPDGSVLANDLRAAAAQRRQAMSDVFVHRVLCASDDSFLQRPPLSDESRAVTVLLPFPPQPAGPGLFEPVWEPRFTAREQVILQPDVVQDPGTAALRLRLRPLSADQGGPGALVGDIATFWLAQQAPVV